MRREAPCRAREEIKGMRASFSDVIGIVGKDALDFFVGV